MSEVLDAAFNLVHDHPGGAASLGPRLGKNPATLCHEVTAHGTAKLGIETAVKLSLLTGDMRILNAFADQCGCMVIPVPGADALGEEVMQRVGAAAKEFGEFVSEVAQDAGDGDVSLNEMRRIEKEWGDLLSVGQGLMAHLRALHERGLARRTGGVL